ncbi:TetR family transcriptional regulator [Thiotrichales bacterium 19S11-10]|nr:TetR family transcriptional regulator [Thiotrichales bacterium 19S11-10]MCF6806941.1 TetR family transcriptional regulator [Thiotrichales bacterium 19S9-11]MCF6810910.1 TetR family transcriptional regulator [Thiotrichales bacterium 19S9-12]
MPLKIRNAANHLVEVACDLFAKYGYDSVSVRQIAKASDLNIASISYYFGSKDELYIACANNLVDYLLEQVQSFNQINYQCPKTRLYAYLKERIAIYLDPRASILFNLYLREKLTPTTAYNILFKAIDKLAEQSYGMLKSTYTDASEMEIITKHLGISGYLLLLVTSKDKVFKDLKIKNDTQAISIIFDQLKSLYL